MKTTGKWLVALAFGLMAVGQASAETGKANHPDVPALKSAAWERVGDAGATGPTADAVKAQAPGEGGLKARKADMVRRMFWIMMAHR